jgi:aspartate aminotransferase
LAVAEKIKGMMERSSWIRKMFETGNELKAKHGRDRVFDFSLGNPNLEPPAAFIGNIQELLTLPQSHGYMPNAGYPDVRSQVAEYVAAEQGVELTGDQIIMTCGAGGALNVALKSIINPGDVVLAATPCFMEYAFYVDNHGGKLELVNSKADFDLDVGAFESAITDRTAAVIINSPNNPSGRVYPRSTIEALGEMLRRKSRETGRGIYLVSDEPYRKIVYEGTEVPSILAAYENSIVASSYSKDLSIPGERIGFLATNPKADGSTDLINGMILCNRILGFVNAPALWQRAVARAQGLSVNVDDYKRKRDKLCDGLAQIGYEFQKPEGTFYLFPKSPQEDEMRIVDALQRELILVVPGKGFGCPGHFRIAFCVDDRVIEGSMTGFRRAFQKAKE